MLIIDDIDTKIWNIVTYKSVDKQIFKIIMICVHSQM